MTEGTDYSGSSNKKMSKTLRIFKVTVFCALIYGLTFYVRENYEKLKIKPEVLVNEKLVSSRTVPFPAITICIPLLVKIDKLNITKCFEEVKGGKIPKKKDLQTLMALSHVCNNNHEELMKVSINQSIDFDDAATLDQISPKINEMFSDCSFDGPQQCEHVLIRSLTDYGYCYSFNMLGYHSIFNDGISDNFDTYKRKKILKCFDPNSERQFFDDEINPEPSNWSLQNGYSTNDNHVQPMRATRGRAFLTQFKDHYFNFFNYCVARNFILNVFLHLPNEIPTFMHPEYAYKLNTAKNMKISAEIKENDETLQNFEIKERECFFEDERSLKFFKSYTKNNCEYECLINFTLQYCGCVRVTMPRTNDMPVCKLKDISCYHTVSDSWPNFYYSDPKHHEEFPDFPCDCMPLCTQIKYTITDKLSLNYIRQSSDELFYTNVMIWFEDSQIVKRTNYVTYKLLNFMSDVGGLLGLFLGFSLLSLFELLLRICSYLKKKMDDLINRLNQKVEASGSDASLTEINSNMNLETTGNEAIDNEQDGQIFVIQDFSKIPIVIQDLEG